MKRTGRIALGFVGAAVTVAALAAPSLAGNAPAATSTTSSTSNTKPLLPASCNYPPVTTPRIVITSSVASIASRKNFTISGTVKVNSCGLPLRIVGLYRSSSANGKFVLDDSTVTNASGAFSFTVCLTQTSYYKVVSAAGLGYNSATSNVVTVTRR